MFAGRQRAFDGHLGCVILVLSAFHAMVLGGQSPESVGQFALGAVSADGSSGGHHVTVWLLSYRCVDPASRVDLSGILLVGDSLGSLRYQRREDTSIP